MQTTNALVRPFLTDFYEITMAYAYWKNGLHDASAVFDLFFRKNPFGGEFTVFAGLEEALRFVSDFRIEAEDIAYLKEGLYRSWQQEKLEFEEKLMHGTIRKKEGEYYEESPSGGLHKVDYPSTGKYVTPPMAQCEKEFFDWLRTLDCSKVRIYALKEGSFAFPLLPLLRVEGPLAVVQLLETTLLNLVNYATLVATNAARFRLAAGPGKRLLEFGLRRAQGPDGAVSASHYCYMGGFDATSNVLAGKLFGIPVRGTHAHSFVSAFSSLDDLQTPMLVDPAGNEVPFLDRVLSIRKELSFENTHIGELAAFISYAQAFPKSFLALVDTYDTLKSGVRNFLCVAAALLQMGYKPIGIRLDSGDLAYLSKEARRMFVETLVRFGLDHKFTIVASNDINEATMHSLNQQGHEIDTFGIGTHLVTCQSQPALGGVYKLVEVNHKQRIKLSQEKAKMTIPGRKNAYRIFGEEGTPLLDILMSAEEMPPEPGQKILCRHPFDAAKRAYVTPKRVLPLHQCVWDGRFTMGFPTLEEKRQYVLQQLSLFRSDYLRPLNPTPYKVSISDTLYNFFHNLWLEEAPIDEIK